MSGAVVTSELRSWGKPVGSVEGLLGLAGGSDALDASDALGGETDGDRTVRGATDWGAGGAIEGARGAIGAWLARGAIDAGLAVATAASGAGGSVMRRVPGATLTGVGLSFTALTGAAAASRALVSSASASAMSGGRPCAVAASSWPLPASLRTAGAFAAGATPPIVLRPTFERTAPLCAEPGRGARVPPPALKFRTSDPTAAPIRKLK